VTASLDSKVEKPLKRLLAKEAAVRVSKPEMTRDELRRQHHLAVSLNTEANSLLLQGDYEGAISRYERISTLYPALPQARFNVANALSSRAELKEAGPPESFNESLLDYRLAAQHFQRAVYLNPKDSGFYHRLGQAIAKSNLSPVSDWHYTSGTQVTITLTLRVTLTLRETLTLRVTLTPTLTPNPTPTLTLTPTLIVTPTPMA